MNLWQAMLYSGVRGAVIGVLAVAIGAALAELMKWVGIGGIGGGGGIGSGWRGDGGERLGGRVVRVVLKWGVVMGVLGPMVLPSLVVGYGWGDTSMSLVRHEWLNEVMYCLVLLGRYGVVGGFIMLLGPGDEMGVKGEGRWCAKMAGLDGGVWGRLKWWCSGWIGRGVIAFCVVFLLVFGEFEIASLVGVSGWSVQLFDAKTMGMSNGETLMRIGWPTGVQAGVVGLCAWWYMNREGKLGVNDGGVEMRDGGEAEGMGGWWVKILRGMGVVWMFAGLLFVVILPGVWMMGDAARGMGRLVGDGMFSEDLGWSALYAGAGSAGAIGLLAMVRGLGRKMKMGTMVDVVIGGIAAVGLSGGLVVGLVMVQLLQLKGLEWMYGTWLAVGMGLAVVLMPIVWVLGLLARSQRERQAVHIAKMMWRGGHDGGVRRMGMRLWWKGGGRLWYWMGAYVFFQGFFELSASYILHPAGGTPAAVRMYNLMHYGNSQRLSAMVVVSVLVCAGAVLIGGLLMRLLGEVASKVFYEVAR